MPLKLEGYWRHERPPAPPPRPRGAPGECNTLQIWVIGGPNIIDQTIESVEEFYLSRIPGEYDCDGFIDLSSVYKALITKKELIAFEVYQRFYEIGKPSGIEETEKYLNSI